MTELFTKLGQLTLNTPLVLASGIWGTSATLLKRAGLAGAGAVTAKSCSIAERAGHGNPVMADWTHGLINAVGLRNPGVDEEIGMLKTAKDLLKQDNIKIIASIFAATVDEYYEVAKRIIEAEPDLVEVNISCPNVADEFGTPFAAIPQVAAEVTAAVRKACPIPITIKLAPNVPSIGRVAKAVAEAGADMITAINTMPGLVIDPYAGKPVLFNKSGGLSGPAIKPIALRCVAEIYRSVDIPIIGTGGVLTGQDAVEMIMAGASAVGVGSVITYRGTEAFGMILDEMTALMLTLGYKSIEDFKGMAA